MCARWAQAPAAQAQFVRRPRDRKRFAGVELWGSYLEVSMPTGACRFLAIALWPLLACSRATEPSSCGDARSLDPALTIPPDTSAVRTIDDRWAAIARQVPGGWGGFLLDSKGRPTVYLVHPEMRQEALAALYAEEVGLPLYDVRTAQVWQGRWDFAQLYDWYRYINARIGTPDGLYSRDIDEGRNRLTYGVDSTAKAGLQSLLETLGLPCDLVNISVESPASALSPSGRLTRASSGPARGARGVVRLVSASECD